MAIKTISYSYLHLAACPLAVFLKYEAGLRGPMNEYLALGNALHLALEKGHRGDRYDGPYAHSIFVKEFNRIIDEDEIFIGYPKKKKMESEGIQMLELYTKQVLAGQIEPVPYKIEEGFKLPYRNIKVIGRIDKIEYEQGYGYTVIDYKSGGKIPDEWFLRHNLQLTTYAWACLELYGELPRKVVWHQLRTGKRMETDRTMEDIEELKRMIDNIIFMDENKIRHRIFHEQVCGYCDFAGPGHECEDFQIEEKVLRGEYSNGRGVDSNNSD